MNKNQMWNFRNYCTLEDIMKRLRDFVGKFFRLVNNIPSNSISRPVLICSVNSGSYRIILLNPTFNFFKFLCLTSASVGSVVNKLWSSSSSVRFGKWPKLWPSCKKILSSNLFPDMDKTSSVVRLFKTSRKRSLFWKGTYYDLFFLLYHSHIFLFFLKPCHFLWVQKWSGHSWVMNQQNYFGPRPKLFPETFSTILYQTLQSYTLYK